MVEACNAANGQYLIYIHSIPSSPHEECRFIAKTLEDHQVHIANRFSVKDIFKYFSGKETKERKLKFIM